MDVQESLNLNTENLAIDICPTHESPKILKLKIKLFPHESYKIFSSVTWV